MKKITESASLYRHLEQMSTAVLLININQDDQKVAVAVQKALPQVAPLVELIAEKLKNGGRLFYIGAGTSGRLGILDAAECPPTFGVPDNMVIGLIAGGDAAIRKGIENAEDSLEQAWRDLQVHGIDERDVLVGISASGTTPYVLDALKSCVLHGIKTACITCNPATPMAEVADYPIEVIVGPEFVTGSTRMKAGTAQKLVLNMLSTATMIKLGRVKDNTMVDMQLTNAKLIDRGSRFLSLELSVSYQEAKELLLQYGSIRRVLLSQQDKS